MNSASARSLLTALGAGIFFAEGLWVLYNGHLSDDALILYTYVNNLAAGHGIVYRPGAGPAEGATDFLWMVLLTGLVKAGLDVAFAAILLNTAGIAVILAILMRRALPRNAAPGEAAGAAALLLAVVVSEPAQASLGGFGVLFYAALCLLVWELGLVENRRLLVWMPVLGLLLGLVRPDGVIVGAVVTLVTLVRLWRDPLRNRYIAVMAVAAAAGIGYFMWRYAYFGLLLPLPLYVKSSEQSAFPGLAGNVLWFALNAPLFIVALFGWQWTGMSRGRYLASWLPFLTLVLLLTMAHQSQNIAFRFQAPATVVLLYVFAAYIGGSFGAAAPTTRRVAAAALLAVTIGLSVWTASHGLRLLTAREYASPFTARLDQLVGPETRMAVTEAGRAAFWTDAHVVDLIGLNTVKTARTEADATYLSEFDPDLLVVFVGHILDVPVAETGTAPLLEVTAAQIAGWRAAAVGDAGPTDLVRTDRVPLAAVEYLARNEGRYRIFLVWYLGWYKHLYAVKSGAVDTEAFLEALRASTEPANFQSYAALRFGR